MLDGLDLILNDLTFGDPLIESLRMILRDPLPDILAGKSGNHRQPRKTPPWQKTFFTPGP